MTRCWSIQGGCPAKDQVGTMGNDADAQLPYQYDDNIPAGLSAG